MERSGSELDLPGFRFHPTEEELLDFYLKRVVHGKKLNFDIIGTLNLYRHDPWELPGLAKIGEREWYFFVPRDRKQANGGRPNRTTERGFWKATGSDRPIRSVSDPKRLIGLKKTLVFYKGRAPRGSKTDWVMNEYRLPDSTSSSTTTTTVAGTTSSFKEDIVLCKIYRKATSLKELEQRAAMEEDTRAAATILPTAAQFCCPTVDNTSFSSSSTDDGDQHNYFQLKPTTPPPTTTVLFQAEGRRMEMKEEAVTELEAEVSSVTYWAAPTPAPEEEASPEESVKRSLPELPELQVPKYTTFEWFQQDLFLTQLRSPWLEHWSPYYANVLNF